MERRKQSLQICRGIHEQIRSLRSSRHRPSGEHRRHRGLRQRTRYRRGPNDLLSERSAFGFQKRRRAHDVCRTVASEECRKRRLCFRKGFLVQRTGQARYQLRGQILLSLDEKFRRKMPGLGKLSQRNERRFMGSPSDVAVQLDCRHVR